MKKILIISGVLTLSALPVGVALKTDDHDLVNKDTGLEFGQAFATLSNSSTSAFVSNSVAGAVWVSSYIVESLPLATTLPGNILWAISGYHFEADKKI